MRHVEQKREFSDPCEDGGELGRGMAYCRLFGTANSVAGGSVISPCCGDVSEIQMVVENREKYFIEKVCRIALEAVPSGHETIILSVRSLVAVEANQILTSAKCRSHESIFWSWIVDATRFMDRTNWRIGCSDSADSATLENLPTHAVVDGGEGVCWLLWRSCCSLELEAANRELEACLRASTGARKEHVGDETEN